MKKVTERFSLWTGKKGEHEIGWDYTFIFLIPTSEVIFDYEGRFT